MTPKQTKLVEQAHEIIDRTSFQVAFMQAGANLTSIFTGGITHVIGDGVGIAWQVVLTNELCTNFERQPSASAISNGLFSMLPDLLTNLALDRGIAAFVPFVGLPVCVASGLNLTWRIGVVVTALCVIPEEKQTTEALGIIAKTVIAHYPRSDFLFTLTSPSKAKFLALIDRMDADHNPPPAATYTVLPPKPQAPLPKAAAENETPEESEVEEEDDFEVESVEVEEEYGVVVWHGEENAAPDADRDLPVAVIPNALLPYRSSYTSPPTTPEEPKPQTGAGKRKHVATGRPKGRPKTSGNTQKSLL